MVKKRTGKSAIYLLIQYINVYINYIIFKLHILSIYFILQYYILLSIEIKYIYIYIETLFFILNITCDMYT